MSEPSAVRFALPVAILAGGLALRLRPLTEKIPKSLIEIAGEPFIAHQLRLLRRENITRVVMCVGFLGEMIADYVGDGSRFGLSVEYSSDGPDLLGTGGALRKALPLLGGEFLVLYGDSYLDTSYAPIVARFHAAGMLGLMTVFHNEGRWDASNVEFIDGIIRSYDKRAPVPRAQYIDYGLGVLKVSAFDLMPKSGPFDLAALHGQLVARGELAGYEARERFYEIGSGQGIADLNRYLRSSASAT